MRERYEELAGRTRDALKKVRVSVEKGSFLFEIVEDFLKIARMYYEDSKYFAKKGDYATAISAVSYAHAWIDACVRLGLLKGEGDLFMKR